MKLGEFRAAFNAQLDKLEAENPGITDAEVVSWGRDNTSLTPRIIDRLLEEPNGLFGLLDATSDVVRALPPGYPQSQVVSIEI